MKHWQTSVASALMVALAGCAGMPMQGMGLSVASRAPSPEEQATYGTHLAPVVANKDQFKPYGPDATRKDLTQLRHNGRTRFELDAAEQDLNRILQRLHDAAGLSTPVAKVHLLPASEFEAFTLANGTIFVTVGVLPALDTEDELAALLAHELGHVLLRHHAKDFTQQVADRALKYGELYFMLKQGSSSERGYASAKAASWAAENALFPSWNRDQESTADLIAVDLLARAGYRADALTGVLDRLDAAAEQKANFILQNPLTVKNEGSNAKIGVDMNVLAENAMQYVKGQLGDNYASGQERRKAVRDYARERWADQRRATRTTLTTLENLPPAQAERLKTLAQVHQLEQAIMANQRDKAINKTAGALPGSPLASDPYTLDVLYYWALNGKDTNGAQQYLQNLLATGQATLSAYQRHADSLAERGDIQGALDATLKASREFDEPAVLYPRLIQYYQQLNQGLMVTLYQAKCLATGDTNLINLCKPER